MLWSVMLPPYPTERWALAKQLGATHAVTPLPNPEGADRPWDYLPLLHLKTRVEDAGLALAVIEAAPPINRAKLGAAGRDEEIEHFCTQVRNMGRLGIPVLCWNWMVQFSWLRTATDTRTRGGALVTSYDHALMRDAPLTEAGEVSDERLWETLEYFLRCVVPVAEEAGVKLALHPDDPPLSPIRGLARIIRSPEAMARALALVSSAAHGITYCQGNFAAMNADIPATIRSFAEPHTMHFAHFRDIRGAAGRFDETFHDDGKTDMFAAMCAYHDAGYRGPMRCDHVPTMAGESNEYPGYAMLGRLFAIGYMKGLWEAAGKTAAARHAVRTPS